MGSDHRLTTRQMAQFVTDGYLRFDSIVPGHINDRVVDELGRLKDERHTPDGTGPPDSLTPFVDCYPPPSLIGEYLRLPEIVGIVESLVGPGSVFDHDWTHHLPAGSQYQQPLHADAIMDSDDPTFDIQLFYFPHDVAAGHGGTRFIPGSHLRRVRPSGLDRYQHIVGEQSYEGRAGTVMVFHHGLWHAGQVNNGDRDRWMHKVRLNPTVAQTRHWNTEDLDLLHNPPSDHFFARMGPDTVANTFRTWHPWHGVTAHRNEQVQRAKLWRYLTGDDTYDVDYYLTRLEQRAKLVEP